MAAELTVVFSAGRGDGVAVPFRPRDKGRERFAELTGNGGEAVFDLGRHGRVHGPDEQAVAFQLAQVEDEHPAADALDGALQLGEADGPGSGRDDDADAPLAPDVVVAASVRSLGRTTLVIPADLTDVSQPVEIIEHAIAERGRLDILVNNAGGAMPASYLDTTPEALDEAFHFNVAAPFELTKRATPYLLESGRGSVVNITSRMDRLVARGMVTYGTIKAAVTQLTRLLAAELAPGVRVNGVAPGVVETDALAQRGTSLSVAARARLSLSGTRSSPPPSRTWPSASPRRTPGG